MTVYPLCGILCSSLNQSHSTQTGMVKMKKMENTKGWDGFGALMHCQWEGKSGTLLWKMIWQQLLKLYIYISYYPAIPLKDIPNRNANIYSLKAIHQNVHSSMARKQNLETTKCPSIIDWINKLQYIYTMEYYKACVLKGSNILPSHRAKIGLGV